MSERRARDADIVSRFKAGETLQSIADRYGITRERVRQIAGKHVPETRRQQFHAVDVQIANDIAARRLTRRQAVAAYGVSVANRASRQYGVVYPAKVPDPTVVEAAALVSGGMSIHQAASGDRALRAKIASYCRKMGIVSRHGRWLDRSERVKAVKSMRSAGASWAEITAYVGSMEGKTIVCRALYQWAKVHMLPEEYAKPARVKVWPAPVAVAPEWQPKLLAPVKRRARNQVAKPKVVYHSDIKKAAELNYGKAPASIIAAVHGVSRNVIIGHWFRLRRAGVLA